MNKNLLRLIATLFAISCFIPAFSQISEGGLPPSFKFASVHSSLPYFEIPVEFDVDQLFEEDAERAEMDLPPRCAYIIPSQLDLAKDGEWMLLPDGTQICQLKIQAPGAIAILLGYQKFNIPVGGKLFIYNPDHTKILGAYSENTNRLGQEFATEFVYGDQLILEYVSPAPLTQSPLLPEIILDGIHYGYNHIWTPGKEAKGTDDITVEPCMLNVNCPEGDDWQDQKKGVARIYCGGYLCSGSMIQNTSQDYDPLFLSAYHCYENMSTSMINQSVYYFHYESADCNSNSLVPHGKTITGAQYLVKIPWVNGSDGALLRLNSPIPENYDVYFNGWDRRNTPASSGVSIHHPDGAVKKISTFKDPLATMTYNTCATNAHWRVYWSATVSGHSSTEGGSSGSPIFNQNGLVVGTLSGGHASCYNLNGLDAYGKLWYHWDQHTQKMNQYLDPNNTGLEILPGSYIGGGIPMANFQYEPREIIVNKPVVFTNKSVQALSHNWTFENGNPASSTEKDPEVLFTKPGKATITLTINQGTANEDAKTIVVDVTEEVYPVADFLMNGSAKDNIEIYQGQEVVFANQSVGSRISYSWEFENGKPEQSNKKDETVFYEAIGKHKVKLTIDSYLGSDSKEKTVTVVPQTPVARFTSSSQYMTTYPNNGQLLPYEGGSVSYTDQSANYPTEWDWLLTGADPASLTGKSVETVYPAGGKNYPVRLTVSNAAGSAVSNQEDYIQLGGTSQVWNIPAGKSGDEIFQLSTNNYLTGTNSNYSTIAERFQNDKPGTIDQVDIHFKVIEGNLSGKYYGISIYSDKEGLPGTSLGVKTIDGAIINPEGYTTVTFNKPIEVDGPFYIVISGLGSSSSLLAVGAAETDHASTYVRIRSQWESLYDFSGKIWEVAMNVVPRFTFKFPEQEIVAPSNVRAAYNWHALYAQIDWTLESSFSGMATYKVYRNNTVIATDLTDTSYQDYQFTDLENNCYHVVAEYGKGVESEASEQACIYINTGIENVDLSGIEVYPNPVQELLTIQSDHPIQQITIQDIQGRTMKTVSGEGVTNPRVSFGSFSQGIYFVRIQTDKGVVIYKVIKN